MEMNEFIRLALAEDIGDGDHSSMSTIPEQAQKRARLIVKDDGIIAGIELAVNIFNHYDKNMQVELRLKDGDKVKKGDIAFYVTGSARSILSCERLVLNCMQRMSGIATQTNMLVQKLEGLNTRLLDTRKTTPLFRQMEKWAVKIGGGVNHRFGLFDMIMIKDNHVDYAGGIKNAIERANEYLVKNNKQLKIIVEARNMKEVEEVMQEKGIFRILLDNFTPEEMKKAIVFINKRIPTEASGGITIDNIRAYAETGVDFISCGALTHSYKSLDMSLKADA